jgi:threonine dehydrogenase-like Zn-dependent dehydrogenase
MFTGDRKIEIGRFDDPQPGPGEVVIEVKSSGICGSDLKFYRLGMKEALASFGTGPGDLEEDVPIIAGHEPCGIVAEIGPGVDSSISVGDRVMVFHYTGCGLCRECRAGWTQLCERGTELIGSTVHGGHADYLKVPSVALLPLPDELSFTAGAAVACGTGTAYGGLRRLNLTARDTIAIFGLGPVGQAAVQLATAMGAPVFGVDIARDRVTMASTFGAVHTIDSSVSDPVEVIRELTGGHGVSCALDVSGASSARQAAVSSTATWGRVAFVGHGPSTEFDISRDVIRRQLSLIGSYTFSDQGMYDCARFIADHGVDAEAVFTDRWSLDEAEQAYIQFDKQTGGKAVFEF